MKILAWVVVVVSLVAAVFAIVFAVLPDEAEMERRRAVYVWQANAWTVRMKRPALVVDCHPGGLAWQCDVTPEAGQPYALTCAGKTCFLATCQP